MNDFILKGDICYSHDLDNLFTAVDHYLICENGIWQGVFAEVPTEYWNFPLHDYSNHLILPGLIDLHTHAPQYAYRALGMDLGLMDWLDTYTFPAESRYDDLEHALKTYRKLLTTLIDGPNTRICLFATIHNQATLALMELLEQSGLICHVGKLSMDRNCLPALCEAEPLKDVEEFIIKALADFERTKPILTPRFVPTCSDQLLQGLADLQAKYNLTLQSHLSENKDEIAFVKELCPDSSCYIDAYLKQGLLQGPTIMAHCIWGEAEEQKILLDNKVFIAHCPQSNMNIASGIAPIRKYLSQGQQVGLGSDVAGGCHNSIFRAMTDAIQVSNLYYCLVDAEQAPLSLNEAFYLGTKGGGAYFGKVGSLEAGYEADAIIIDDSSLIDEDYSGLAERLARVAYLSHDYHIKAKYVAGRMVKGDVNS